MKVMIYRYNSICEPDVIEALNDLDFEVIEMKTEMTKKDLEPSLAVKLISDFLQANPVDFVFSINFFPYLAEVCNLFKLCYVSWIVDAPVLELYTRSVTRPYNRIFIFDRALYNDIESFNPGRIFHFPLAANTEKKTRLFRETSQDIKNKYSHDITFVGSLYTEKCPYDKVGSLRPDTKGYLEGLMKAQERIYGYYFIEELLTDEIVTEFIDAMPDFYRLPEGSFLSDKRTLSQYYMGNKISAMERVDTFDSLSKKFKVSLYTGSDTTKLPKVHNMGYAKTHTEMPLIFNLSKINLNITSKAIRTGLPLRIFDILSSRGFLISNYQEEICEYMIPGEEIIIYTEQKELEELIEYYLDHEKERNIIAENGFEKIKNEYSYKKRMEIMLKMAFSI